MERAFLVAGGVILPDRVASGSSILVEAGRVGDVIPHAISSSSADRIVRLDDAIVAPGFVDLHVHGVNGVDVLDGVDAVARVASYLPRWGVSAFCPTAVACPPDVLRQFLQQVRHLRAQPPAGSARVLPAHLESNFLNPEFRGAQPAAHLCPPEGAGCAFTAADVLAIVDAFRAEIGIVTLAPEMPGAMDLIRRLVSIGVLVSLGHSGATCEEARAALAAGATRATHLFNAMRPMTHQEPGLAGAVLADEQTSVEIICDGHHVHPTLMRVVIAAKGPDRVVGITDGTAASGLEPGSRVKLGDQPITAYEVARLDDGTRAGSVLTMDRAFSTLVRTCGCDLVQAATMCATTPASDIRLRDRGVIAPGAAADLTVLDRDLRVRQTWIGGELAWADTAFDR
jgi:N-acetylglucosamine-6-phosphate deacetylase